MNSRLVLAGVAAAGLIVVGCQSQPSQPTPSNTSMHSGVTAVNLNPGASSPSTPNVDFSPGSATRPAGADDSTASLLAHTTATYAQSVTPRSGGKVDWLNPQSTDPANPLAAGAKPKPVQVEIASANSDHASAPIVNAPKDGPVPRIVPEGEDLPGADQTKIEPTTDALAAKLTQQVHDYPRDIASQMDLQFLQFLRDEPVPSMDALASLPNEDREILSAVMDGMSNFRNTVRSDRNLLVSRKVQPLLDMADRLRALADLEIPTLTLCRRVSGFGNYEPMDTSFEAGVEHPTILYCEIENFVSTLDDKKMWETRISQEAVLYTETGLKVWGDSTPAFTDYSRNRRHDFYMVKKITLPANLTIGRYLLKVSIVDQQANHIREASLPIQIVAQ